MYLTGSFIKVTRGSRFCNGDVMHSARKLCVEQLAQLLIKNCLNPGKEGTWPLQPGHNSRHKFAVTLLIIGWEHVYDTQWLCLQVI